MRQMALYCDAANVLVPTIFKMGSSGRFFLRFSAFRLGSGNQFAYSKSPFTYIGDLGIERTSKQLSHKVMVNALRMGILCEARRTYTNHAAHGSSGSGRSMLHYLRGSAVSYVGIDSIECICDSRCAQIDLEVPETFADARSRGFS